MAVDMGGHIAVPHNEIMSNSGQWLKNPDRHRVRSAVNVRPHGNYYRLLICGRSRASARAETSAQARANGLRTFGGLRVPDNVPVCKYSPFAGISSGTLALESPQPVPTPVRLSRLWQTLANSRVGAGYGLPYQRYLQYLGSPLPAVQSLSVAFFMKKNRPKGEVFGV